MKNASRKLRCIEYSTYRKSYKYFHTDEDIQSYGIVDFEFGSRIPICVDYQCYSNLMLLVYFKNKALWASEPVDVSRQGPMLGNALKSLIDSSNEVY